MGWGTVLFSEAKKGREEPFCFGREAAYLFSVLTAERFFSGVPHAHLLGVRVRTLFFRTQAQPLGDGRGEQWEGRGSGDATALTQNQAAKWQADGVQAAGSTGARTAPPDARAGLAVSVTGEADVQSHNAILCAINPSRGDPLGRGCVRDLLAKRTHNMCCVPHRAARPTPRCAARNERAP